MPIRPAHLLSLAIFFFATLCYAQGLDLRFGEPTSNGPPVTARAVVNTSPLLPGTSAQIAVELTINPRFHIQSAFAAKPYIAARLTPKPSPGISYGDIQYQKATDIPTPPALGTGTLSVYEHQVYILLPITIAPDAPPGDTTLELSLRTQACDDKTCQPPKNLALKIPLTIGKSTDTPAPADAALFNAAAKQQYATLPADTAPATTASATAAAPTPAAQNAGPGHDVPLLSNDQQLAAIASRPYAPRNSDENSHSLPAIFLFALVGGLILNVMPCVLPVIPLKALSFVQQAHGNPRVALLHGITFSAGIVSLFVALALVLRTFGLFYGQQFQSPAFIITMTLFVVALSLSMIGVWTINPPQVVYQLDARISEAGHSTLPYASPGGGAKEPAHPYLSSFGGGIMATLLATPCSAPFLGPVFAYALVQGPWLTALMLAVVGLGMSLPYLLLAAFPKLLNKIPRAGRWSELLKQGLGIVMLGVAFYLLTRIPNTQLWPWALAAVVVTGLVCWAWGQIPSPIAPRAQIYTIRAVSLSVGIILGIAIYFLAINTANTRPLMNPSGTASLPDRSTGEDWLPFNVALLDEALQQGRPVVVDWTADWCINCRVLEATVLNRDEAQKAFAQSNALLLRADLSEDNPPATALNKKLGSEAIPVLAIFQPTRPTDPVVLRDSYTTARVTSELKTR